MSDKAGPYIPAAICAFMADTIGGRTGLCALAVATASARSALRADKSVPSPLVALDAATGAAWLASVAAWLLEVRFALASCSG
jgi:hypothetical protein